MIVNRILIERFRGRVDPCEIQLDPHRINILHGPNGCGKSTLLHGLISAFLQQHDATNIEVRKLKPWGTELGPIAEVSFQIKDRSYTIRKKWLQSKLAEFRDGDRLIAEAKQAEERLKQIVDFDAIPTLWARQGQLADIPVGTSFHKAVEASLQIQSTDPVTDKIRTLAEKRYLEFFAPITGKLKSGARLQTLGGELQAAKSALATVEAAQSAIAMHTENLLQWSEQRRPLESSLTQLEQHETLHTIKLSIGIHESLASDQKALAALPPFDPAAENAPSIEQLARLRQQQNQLAQRQAELHASQIHLSLPPTARYDVLEGEAGPNPGQVSGSPRVRIRLEGIGEIEARGPVQDLTPLRANIATLTQTLAQAGDLDLLEVKQARAATNRQVQTLTRSIQNLTANLGSTTDSLPDLYARRTRLEADLADKPQAPKDAKTRLQQLDRQIQSVQLAIAAKGEAAAKNPDELQAIVDQAQASFNEEEVRVHATRLLWQSFQAEEAAKDTGYIEQVQRRANQMYSLLVAQPADSIRLSKALAPAKYGEADLAQLSGGEYEQIHLVTRLALAEYLALDDRQLVVLDDALTATDQTRLDRLLEYIATRLDRLQVLFLTCHPERFAKLRDNANWIEL